ncbi:hypothetical protein HCY46_05410 [Limosilactobacillus fermentum]
MEEQVSSRRHEWRIALTASAPVMLGYIVLGLGYGLYTHNLGFSWWVPTLMALTIYGGSVEFVIANMLTQAFNPLTVLVITLGSILAIQIKGLTFAMTALFLVLALDQILKEKSHVSSVSGLVITVVCLALVGSTYFLLVTLLLLVVEFTILYRRRAMK